MFVIVDSSPVSLDFNDAISDLFTELSLYNDPIFDSSAVKRDFIDEISPYAVEMLLSSIVCVDVIASICVCNVFVVSPFFDNNK